jgi:hypothetical protein
VQTCQQSVSFPLTDCLACHVISPFNSSQTTQILQAVQAEGESPIERPQRPDSAKALRRNHSLFDFERPEFRAMWEAANPEAVTALWSSHNSVSRYVMRLHNYLQPCYAVELSNALSKIHISFDGWTVLGGKRGF